ncbi:hypothetical protein PENTCL1PPCAC_9618, partial [Pristionchus entomophagus]
QVNFKNMVRNNERVVLSFHFVRREVYYKCCKEPWVMLYAQIVIKRKPLYYIVNLVIPTSIITIVAVTGFFTPTSSSSERDEKLYLGIDTLLTMSIMMLMVCNQMPSTSTYVPLMCWYYIGIIFVIVTGTSDGHVRAGNSRPEAVQSTALQGCETISAQLVRQQLHSRGSDPADRALDGVRYRQCN